MTSRHEFWASLGGKEKSTLKQTHAKMTRLYSLVGRARTEREEAGQRLEIERRQPERGHVGGAATGGGMVGRLRRPRLQAEVRRVVGHIATGVHPTSQRACKHREQTVLYTYYARTSRKIQGWGRSTKLKISSGKIFSLQVSHRYNDNVGW